MLKPHRWGRGTATALVALGAFAAGPRTASSQWVFDPYLPYNSDYVGYVAPIVPNNPALPNAVRYTTEYANGVGSSSRFNTFDRWLNDYESDVSRGRRDIGRGPGRDVDRGDMSRYIPNRLADSKFERQEANRTRGFFDEESLNARIAVERDRYYAAADRVTDPTRRAAYLKVVARLSNPKTAKAMLKEIEEAKEEAAQAPAPNRRPAATADAAPARPRSVLANPPRSRSRATTPAQPASPEAGKPPVQASPSSSTSKPSSPSTVRPAETPSPGPSAPAPLPSGNPGDATLPAPVPLPDDLPPPPR